MNDLQIFNSEQFGQLRTVKLDGEPWAVGKDVAAALGYSNTRDALAKHVDNEDKRASRFATPSGEQEMTIINESGIYSLIFSSKLPAAKAFKHWVTSEVLPAIRRTGSYSANPTISPEIALSLIKDFSAAQTNQERLLVVGMVRTFGVDKRTMDLLESQLLSESRVDPAPAPANRKKRETPVIVPRKYRKLLARIVEIGEKDNSGPIPYIKISFDTVKTEAKKLKIAWYDFVSWMSLNDFFDYEEGPGHKYDSVVNPRSQNYKHYMYLIAKRVIGVAFSEVPS